MINALTGTAHHIMSRQPKNPSLGLPVWIRYLLKLLPMHLILYQNLCHIVPAHMFALTVKQKSHIGRSFVFQMPNTISSH